MRMTSIPQQLSIGLVSVALAMVVVGGFVSRSLPYRRLNEAALADPPAANVSGVTENAVMNIARQRKTNVFIDSTRIDPKASAQPVDPIMRDPKDSARGALIFCTQQYHLSAQDFSPDTLLLWAEPDEEKIAQAVSHGEGFGIERDVASPQAILQSLRAEIDAPALQQALKDQEQKAFRSLRLQDYLAQPQTTETSRHILEIKLSQLSPQLQQQVVPFFIAQTFYHSHQIPFHTEIWDREDIWQRSYLKVISANPVIHTPPTLVVQAQVETPDNRLRLTLLPSSDMASAKVVPPPPGDLSPPVSQRVKPGQLNLLPLRESNEQPIAIEDRVLPSGFGFKSFQIANQVQADLSTETLLAAPSSTEVMRRPLAEFLRDAGEKAGVTLWVSSDVQLTSPLISAHVEAMPLNQMMQAVAKLYGAVWKKNNSQNFTLESSGRSAVEMELLRVGDSFVYRLRDYISSADRRETQEWNDLSARIFDEVGANVMKAPGVAFTSLSPDLQKELRQRAKLAVVRHILEQQTEVRKLLDGEWTLRAAGQAPLGFGGDRTGWSMPNLQLLVNGHPRSSISWLSAPVNNGVEKEIQPSQAP